MNAPAFPDRSRHKFTLSDWAAMEAAGLLPPDSELELIDGDLVEMPADGPIHRRFQHAMIRWIVPRLPDSLAFAVDQTLPKDRHNGPKPDLYVYPAAIHEKDLWAKDVLWALEIADASLSYDANIKGPLYASAGIADYWIVDVNAKAILVHRKPGADGYTNVRTLAADDAIAPLCAPDLIVRLSDLPRLD